MIFIHNLFPFWWLLFILCLHGLWSLSRCNKTEAFIALPVVTSVTSRQLHHCNNDGCWNLMLTMTGGENEEPSNSPKIQFSSSSTPISTTDTNPIDTILSWVTSDIGSIVLGGIGLILLLVGRLVLDDNNIADDSIMTSEAMGEQTRVNLLAVFAIGGVLLNGLSQLDVQTALAEKVDLVGTVVGKPMIIDTNYCDQDQIHWVLSSILAATPAGTVILLVYSEAERRWNPIAFVGILPPNMLLPNPKVAAETPILDRMLRVINAPDMTVRRQESYLPTLQALPGRVELINYLLPTNTQAALLLPIRLTVSSSTSTVSAVLLIGSNQARSFTPRDINWSQTAATRLESSTKRTS